MDVYTFGALNEHQNRRHFQDGGKVSTDDVAFATRKQVFSNLFIKQKAIDFFVATHFVGRAQILPMNHIHIQ